MSAKLGMDWERKRIESLLSYKILDTLAENHFDSITRLASECCEVPIALVSLVDADRQWFKSRIGLPVCETHRSVSFCGQAILQDELFEIEDTHLDSRFSDNPLVTGDPKIRFYAGIPLINSSGFALGTLCVIDRVPRKLSLQQQKILKNLGQQTLMALEQRKLLNESESRFRELKELNERLEQAESLVAHSQRMDSISRFYSTVIHEMRSPLSIIRGALEWIERRPGDPASNARDMDTAKRGVKRVDDILTRLNVFAIGGASSNRISPIELNFPIQDAIQMARFEAQKNGISLSITGTVSSLVLGNPWELMHVFWSLIENSIQAIQHCEDRWVTIDLLNRDGAVVVRIRDSGRGIPAGDMDRIFEPYFSTKPDNSGLGFGLSVAKKVLAKCGAKICYRPDEKNTCFELIFPVVKATEITVRLA